MRIHLVCVALAIAGCAKKAPSVYTADAVPAELAPAVKAANEGIDGMKKRLVGRLKEELEKGGPAAAIDVCRTEAVAITGAVAAERGVELGRTSHKLRNPANAPRPWMAPLLEGQGGKKAEAVPARVVDLGDRVGVLQPLATQELCLSCHGPGEGLSAEVRGILERAYPADQATGFSIGDLRGFAWAEVKKTPPGPAETR
jgi:hypothetical protein